MDESDGTSGFGDRTSFTEASSLSMFVEAPTSYASASASIVIILPLGGDKNVVFAVYLGNRK